MITETWPRTGRISHFARCGLDQLWWPRGTTSGCLTSLRVYSFGCEQQRKRHCQRCPDAHQFPPPPPRPAVTALQPFRPRERFHLLDVLGIHRLRPTKPRLVRCTEAIGQLRIQARQQALSGKEMPHLPSGHGHLRRLFARIRSHDERGIVDPRHRGSNIRLRHQHRVVENRRDLQEVAHAPPPRAHDGAIAAHEAGAADVGFLEVSRRRDEDVAFPLASREPAPGVQRVGRRVRPAVHPDRRLLLLLIQVPVVGDDFLRRWIHVGPHPHLRERSLEGVVPGMWTARILREIVVVWRPGLGAPPAGRAQGNAGVVADHPAAILIAGHGTPEAGDVRLRQGSCDRAAVTATARSNRRNLITARLVRGLPAAATRSSRPRPTWPPVSHRPPCPAEPHHPRAFLRA